jgi:uncharacterized protein YuzE
MSRKLRFSYYEPSDELNIHFDEPKPCVSKEIADEIYLRLDMETRKIVGLTILIFVNDLKELKVKYYLLICQF